MLQRSGKTWKAAQIVAQKDEDESSVESSGDEDDDSGDARLIGRWHPEMHAFKQKLAFKRSVENFCSINNMPLCFTLNLDICSWCDAVITMLLEVEHCSDGYLGCKWKKKEKLRLVSLLEFLPYTHTHTHV